MRVVSIFPAPAALLFALIGLGGCGDDKKGELIQVSPEAKKADDSAQKGMMEFMQSKKAAKGKPKS